MHQNWVVISKHLWQTLHHCHHRHHQQQQLILHHPPIRHSCRQVFNNNHVYNFNFQDQDQPINYWLPHQNQATCLRRLQPITRLAVITICLWYHHSSLLVLMQAQTSPQIHMMGTIHLLLTPTVMETGVQLLIQLMILQLIFWFQRQFLYHRQS